MVAAADEEPEVDGGQELSVHEVLEASITGTTKLVAAAVEHKCRFLFKIGKLFTNFIKF